MRGPVAALLHFRDSLKESAKDWCRAAHVQADYVALKARFGLSLREARSHLSNLREDFCTSLQEHVAEVERLVNIAYGDLPQEHRTEMRLVTFCNTLGYLPLQRHLLAFPTHTLKDTVRVGNEYLQIRPGNEWGSTNICQIEDEEEKEVMNLTEKALNTLMKIMQQLMEKVGHLQNRPTRAAPKEEPVKERLCWECWKERHLKRSCLQQKASQPSDQFRETDKVRNIRVL